ncbi:hypothetical protein [Turicimonas muris]|uniref:hypothetical protein n=1 Tax=Turicimonas muris TaxID=1796652 RepID=UPI0023F38E8A|nr:hypothetical protein [Turicimonas muris]
MLEVKNIVTEIETQEGTIKAVDDLTLTIAPREIYALVGRIRLRKVNDSALSFAFVAGDRPRVIRCCDR